MYKPTIPKEILNSLKIIQKQYNIKSTNHLLNLIVSNMYSTYPINRDRIDKLYSVLESSVPSNKLVETVKQVITIDINTDRLSRDVETERINYKATSLSESIIKDFDLIVYKYNLPSVNVIIREILMKFHTLTSLQKEEILYKKEINEIKEAIKHRHRINMVYNNEQITIKPYKIFEPFDDFSYYLIADDVTNVKGRLIRICKIKEMHTDRYERFNITEKMKNKLDEYNNVKMSVFNNKFAILIKKAMEESEFPGLFKYLIDDSRKSDFKEQNLISRIK